MSFVCFKRLCSLHYCHLGSQMRRLDIGDRKKCSGGWSKYTLVARRSKRLQTRRWCRQSMSAILQRPEAASRNAAGSASAGWCRPSRGDLRRDEKGQGSSRLARPSWMIKAVKSVHRIHRTRVHALLWSHLASSDLGLPLGVSDLGRPSSPWRARW